MSARGSCIHGGVRKAGLALILVIASALCPELSLAVEEKEDLLIAAVRNGELNKAAAFLNAGADANTRDSEGQTLLIIAVEKGSLETVKLLLKKGRPG